MSCKATIALDKEVEEKVGIPHGYTELVEYYSTPMKNCMLAALNLPQLPHQEQDSALAI